jgi:hypothetical protein
MATQKQIQANRLNARRSTGPRTAAGKAKSSQNARKHGLCSRKETKSTLLPGENAADFESLIAEFEELFQPANALEQALVRQLADTEWRMRRVPRLEAATFAYALHESRSHYETFPEALPAGRAQAETYLAGSAISGEGGEAFTQLSRYEGRLSQRFYRALGQLQQAQNRRSSIPATGSEAAPDNFPHPPRPVAPRRPHPPENAPAPGANPTGRRADSRPQAPHGSAARPAAPKQSQGRNPAAATFSQHACRKRPAQPTAHQPHGHRVPNKTNPIQRVFSTNYNKKTNPIIGGNKRRRRPRDFRGQESSVSRGLIPTRA